MSQVTEPNIRPWYLYVVRCADDSLYTGISPDVEARLKKHVSGTGARYLRGRGPLQIVAMAAAGDRALASRAESAFKRLTKAHKEQAICSADGLRLFVERMAN